MKRTLNRKDMSAKIPQTSRKSRTEYLIQRTPQLTLRFAAARAGADIVGVGLDVSAGRHQRAEAGSGFEFVEYALPCHQLAKVVGLDCSVVANRIAELLHLGDYGLDDFKIEAISGYVNFQVPTPMIPEAMRATSR